MDNQQQSNSKEVYKQHPEYPMLEVSNLGDVRRYKDQQPKYVNVNKQGYKVVQVKIKGKIKTLKVHRLVAELFLDPPAKELVDKCSKEHHKVVLVKHLDNNPLNNNAENLEWSDLKGNTQQAWGDKLIPVLRGQLNGKAILTENIVHEICRDFEKGMMPSGAIEKYNISKQQATKIRAGYAWRHVWEQYDIKVNRRNKS